MDASMLKKEFFEAMMDNPAVNLYPIGEDDAFLVMFFGNVFRVTITPHEYEENEGRA